MSAEPGIKCNSYRLYSSPFKVIKNQGSIPDNAEERGWKLERIDPALAEKMIDYYEMLSSR